MAQFAITFPLPGSWIPGTPSRPTVVLKRKSCMQNISILCKATNINKLRTYNIWQWPGLFHNFMMKKKVKSKIFYLWSNLVLLLLGSFHDPNIKAKQACMRSMSKWSYYFTIIPSYIAQSHCVGRSIDSRFVQLFWAKGDIKGCKLFFFNRVGCMEGKYSSPINQTAMAHWFKHTCHISSLNSWLISQMFCKLSKQNKHKIFSSIIIEIMLRSSFREFKFMAVFMLTVIYVNNTNTIHSLCC